MIFIRLKKINFYAVTLATPLPCKYSLRLAKMAGATNIIGADLDTSDISPAFPQRKFLR